MASFGEPARGNVLLPRPVGDHQGDLRVLTEDVHAFVGACIVIGYDRVGMLAEIVERVGQDERLVPDTGHGDEEVLTAEQRPIAGNDALGVAERQALAVLSVTSGCSSWFAYIDSMGSSISTTSSYSPNPLKRLASTR